MISNERTNIENREKEFYSSIYKNKSYNVFGNQLRLNRELHSILKLSGLKKLKKILSVGCGDGEFEILLSPHVEHIVAVDVSSDAISLAKEKQSLANINNIDFRCQSFYDLSWGNDFDTIICLAFLHHVPEQDFIKFLDQIYCHLKPGGFFYSEDPNKYGILRKIGRIILGDTYRKYHTPDERELDPKELESILKKIGFDSVKVNYIDLVLIPSIHMFTKGPRWFMDFCMFIDWFWCKSFFAPGASGFAVFARK